MELKYLLENKRKEIISVNYNIYAPKPIQLIQTNSGLLFYRSLQHLQPHSPTHEPNPVLNPQTTLYDDKITNNQFVCRVCSWNTSVVVSKNHTFEGKEKLLKRSDIQTDRQIPTWMMRTLQVFSFFLLTSVVLAVFPVSYPSAFLCRYHPLQQLFFGRTGHGHEVVVPLVFSGFGIAPE